MSAEGRDSLTYRHPSLPGVVVAWQEVHERQLPDLRLLDETECQRAWCEESRPRRQGFIAGVTLAKETIARCSGYEPTHVRLVRKCERCGRAHGRVEVAHPRGFSVSLSYGEGIVGVAVSMHGSIGLDVEAGSARAKSKYLIDALTAIEIPYQLEDGASSDDLEVVRAWVRWEAVAKACGEGLLLDPATVKWLSQASDEALARVDQLSERSVTALYKRKEAETYRVLDVPAPHGHVSALALRWCSRSEKPYVVADEL